MSDEEQRGGARAFVRRAFRLLGSTFDRAVCAVLIFGVRAYQVTLSPMFGNCCRFKPSCSHYCIEALQVHGAVYGTWLTLKRLGRCRPFGPYGYDPVPPKRTKK